MDLAAAYRQCYRKGLCEGVNNHLTVMIKEDGTEFLTLAFGLM